MKEEVGREVLLGQIFCSRSGADDTLPISTGLFGVHCIDIQVVRFFFLESCSVFFFVIPFSELGKVPLI